MATLLTKPIGATIKDDLIKHFLTLPLGDRQRRFGYSITDKQIIKYVDEAVNDLNNIWIVAYDVKLLSADIVGVLQLSYIKNTKVSEIGVSVSRAAQGKGVGSKLVEAGFRHARLIQSEKVYALTMSSNKSIQHILKKRGIEFVSLGGGEIEGSVEMEHTVEEYLADYANMLLGMYKFGIDFNYDLYGCINRYVPFTRPLTPPM